MTTGQSPQVASLGTSLATQSLLATLVPLQDAGADSLDPQGVPAIARIVLRAFAYRLPSFHILQTLAADDVFRYVAVCGRLCCIPKGATITRAIFDVYFTGSALPHIVEIILPDTIKLQHPADAAPVHDWLTRRGFLIYQKICHLLILAFLLLATATDPLCEDTWEDDDDDGDVPHSALRAPHFLKNEHLARS